MYAYQGQKEISRGVKVIPVPFLGKLSHFVLKKVKTHTFINFLNPTHDCDLKESES